MFPQRKQKSLNKKHEDLKQLMVRFVLEKNVCVAACSVAPPTVQSDTSAFSVFRLRVFLCACVCFLLISFLEEEDSPGTLPSSRVRTEHHSAAKVDLWSSDQSGC